MVGTFSTEERHEMVANDEKYLEIFCDVFEITHDVAQSLEYEGISEWDSVGHMSLMAELEEKFDFVFEMDDIIDFSGFVKGKEILKKYGVIFSSAEDGANGP